MAVRLVQWLLSYEETQHKNPFCLTASEEKCLTKQHVGHTERVSQFAIFVRTFLWSDKHLATYILHMLEMGAKTDVGLRVKGPYFFSIDYNENWHGATNLSRSPKFQNLYKSISGSLVLRRGQRGIAKSMSAFS
jgi:hypothetical protein